jgi:hypothetical protein
VFYKESKAVIVTNNKKVCEKYAKVVDVKVAENYIGVLTTAKYMVSDGYVLLTHPQAGSLKPNQTPYRSVMLEKGSSGGTDVNGVMLLDSAIETYHKFIKNHPVPIYEESIADDHRTIDQSLIDNAIRNYLK